MAAGEKGNLGEKCTGWQSNRMAFTVKYNQCITKHIRGLLKKPSAPCWRPPPTPPPHHHHQWKWPTLSRPTWLRAESHFQKLRGDVWVAWEQLKASDGWVLQLFCWLTLDTQTHTHIQVSRPSLHWQSPQNAAFACIFNYETSKIAVQTLQTS